MKILYGIQGTGNGHIRRAQEIIEPLKKYGSIDILLSGLQSELTIPYPIRYRKHGIFLVSGRHGGPHIERTLRALRIRNLAHDIASLPIKEYDFIISDYEPITAWASYFRRVFSVGLSNQVSFFSPHIPRTKQKNVLVEYFLKRFVPCSYNIGFHYQSYDDFIETPIIPHELRNSATSDGGHIVVYLPAYKLTTLMHCFFQIPEIQWHIFCKEVKQKIVEKNIVIRPIGHDYNEMLLSAHGLISAAGFQSTAEALFLGKKLLAIPQSWHYEQLCNAAALHILGVKTLKKVNKDFPGHVRDWLYKSPILKINYPDNASKIAQKIITAYYDKT